MTNEHNITVQVRLRRGLWGALTGERRGKAIDRTTRRLNAEGYRVVQTIADEWSAGQRFWNWLVSTMTLGVLGTRPCVLIVAELRRP